MKLSDNSCEWYEPVETRLLAGGWAYGESNCLLTNISTEEMCIRDRYYTDYMWPWTAPISETQKNPNLTKRSGWAY